jgi:hypothetical protein
MIDRGALTNRGEGLGQQPPSQPPKPRGVDTAFQERLAEARMLPPPAGACRACFQAGRDAVVALVTREGDASPIPARMAAAAGLQPTHYHNGDRSFQAGRDAVIAAVSGD